MEAKAPMMIAGNFTPGGRLDINMKDIRNVMNASHAASLPLPLTAQLYETMQFLKRHGYIALDHSGIVKYYEDISGVRVKQENEP
jgi:2-hydroxy-3-oxopropionate reductase